MSSNAAAAVTFVLVLIFWLGVLGLAAVLWLS